MLSPVLVLWLAIRILAEFVFLFSLFLASGANLMEFLRPLYALLEEIWQYFFA